MPRDLISLSIAAIDKTARIRHLQKLIDICLDQTIDRGEDSLDKLSLVLDSYRANMDNDLHELEILLIKLKLLLVGIEPDCS